MTKDNQPPVAPITAKTDQAAGSPPDLEGATSSTPAAVESVKSARKDGTPPPLVGYAPAQPVSRSDKLGWRMIAYICRDPDRWWVIGASVAIYALSFVLPAVYFGTDSSYSGASAFSSGLREGFVVWLANPAIWVGWVLLCFRRRWLAFIAGTIAFALCLWVLIDGRIATPMVAFNNEPLHPIGDIHLLAGYACWLASTAVFAVGSLFLALRKHRDDLQRVTSKPAEGTPPLSPTTPVATERH